MGLLNSIKSLGLINVQNVNSTHENHYAQYLDYVYLKPGIKFGDNPQTGIDLEDLKKDGMLSEEAFYSTPPVDWSADEPFEKTLEGAMNRGISSQHFSTMSLILKKEIVDFKDFKVELNPEVDLLDPQIAVYEHLLKKTVSLIKTLAEENAKDLSVKGDFTLNYTQQDDDRNISRKLFSKTLGASNMIATSSRRGPGTFVIARKELIDILSSVFQNTSSYLYQYADSEATVGGLKLFVCEDLGDTVIVGRKGDDEEPGVRLISNDDSLEKDIYFNNTDIVGVNVRYALGSFSENDKRQYIAFTFKLKK